MELKKLITGLVIAFLICPTMMVSGRQKKTKAAGSELMTTIQRFMSYVAEKAKEQKDIELLAEVIYHENWYTDKDHLAAYYTGAVVMNRVHSDEWPDTIQEVLYQRGQYSTTKKFYTVELPDEVYEMAAKIIRNGTPDVPETVIFQSMHRLGSGVWKKVSTDYFCYA